MTDGRFVQMRYGSQKAGKVIEIEIMSSVHHKALRKRPDAKVSNGRQTA